MSSGLLPPTPPFPVVVGVPRSGTTLLRLMLDAHPQLAIPPETGFLLSSELLASQASPGELAGMLLNIPAEAPAWHDFGLNGQTFLEAAHQLPASDGLGNLAGILRLFYRLYAARHGKSRSGDKTPLYLLGMPQVAAVLPEARFIHIVRDGRDVALSWRQTWFAPSRDVPELVRRWAEMILAARTKAEGLPYLEVLYSELILQPEATLRSICDFIELDFHPAMLNYHQHSAVRLKEHGTRYNSHGALLVSHEQRLKQQWRTMTPLDSSRLGQWRQALSESEIVACDRYAGELLQAISIAAK